MALYQVAARLAERRSYHFVKCCAIFMNALNPDSPGGQDYSVEDVAETEYFMAVDCGDPIAAAETSLPGRQTGFHRPDDR